LTLAVVLSASTGRHAAAQEAAPPATPSLRSMLSVDLAGGGTTSLFGGVTDPGRGTLELAVHARVPLLVRSGFEVDYTAGLVPLALAIGTRVTNGGQPGALRSERVGGAGLDGLGFVVRRRGGRWYPYLVALGGVRVFERPVPDPRGLRFNFSADLGGGVAMRMAPGRWLRVGVGLHHLSNAGLGPANPSFNGIDATVMLARS
jgi:hypothetical protein